MNTVNGLELSKANDQKVIEWWKSKGRRAWLATDDEDMEQLIDIWLESRSGEMVPIDTKYVGCSLDHVWHDTTQGRESKKILYCFKKTSYKRCFFVDVAWLEEQVANHQEELRYGKQSGSMLYWFSMLDAAAVGAAREVDLSGIGLELQIVLK